LYLLIIGKANVSLKNVYAIYSYDVIQVRMIISSRAFETLNTVECESHGPDLLLKIFDAVECKNLTTT
jgi:hypothetical protein